MRDSQDATITKNERNEALEDNMAYFDVKLLEEQRRRLQGGSHVEQFQQGQQQQQQRGEEALAQRGFDLFDSNHDSKIDRDEYKEGVKKLVYVLENTPSITTTKNSFFSNTSFLSKLLGASTTTTSTTISKQVEEDEDNTHFWPAFFHSATVIIATEVGDKTFFIAAVLSMKNERLPVLFGALGALYCMTILSVLMGMILPNLLPRQYTSILGGLLFLYFGIKLLRDSRSMQNAVSGELEEVEEELLGLHFSKKKDEDLETGKASTLLINDNTTSTSTNSNKEQQKQQQQQQLSGNLTTSATKRSTTSSGNSNNNHTASSNDINLRKSNSLPYYGSNIVNKQKLFLQSLTLTFLAEWGDRSQIATIALASHKEPYGVTLGGCLGHTICTSVAILGGRMLASRISEKSVAISGGIIFLFFGFHSLLYAP
jgi:putative Ca2+/H+ antiporter (TMEM165/GDT1 family)